MINRDHNPVIQLPSPFPRQFFKDFVNPQQIERPPITIISFQPKIERILLYDGETLRSSTKILFKALLDIFAAKLKDHHVCFGDISLAPTHWLLVDRGSLHAWAVVPSMAWEYADSQTAPEVQAIPRKPWVLPKPPVILPLGKTQKQLFDKTWKPF